MEAYPSAVEAKMQKLYRWLSEKDRRRYAAIEAEKLGHGGTDYIARLHGGDSEAVHRASEDEYGVAGDGGHLGEGV